MKKSIVEKKRVGLESQEELMAYLLEKIRFQLTPRGLNYCYESLANCHRTRAMFDFFVDGKIESFKQNMYVASRLDVAAIALYDHQRFSTGQEILYALLTDNEKLINDISHIHPPDYVRERTNPAHSQYLVHMYQLTLRGDYEALKNRVHHIAERGKAKNSVLFSEGKDFFSLLIQRDKEGLERLIARHSRIQSQDVLLEDFMCFQGTLEAKICWLKGIEVRINSPLLPMSLMPIKPLEHYDDVYDFLKPGYIPPKVGWLERVHYRLKDRARRKKLIQAAIEASSKK